MTALATMLMSLCLAHIGQSEPTITYTCPGKNAKAVFEDLSKQAGQTLLIGQSLAEEPIILRLDKAPLSKTMERLAFALNGEWKEEKEGNRLVALKTKEDFAAYNYRLRTIKAIQAKVKQELENIKPFDNKMAVALATELEDYFKNLETLPEDDERRYDVGSKFRDRSPSEAFCKRIFTSLDPKLLTEIGNFERVVWSSHPTVKQRQLPSGAWNVALQYLRESQNWSRELLNRPSLLDKMNEYSFLLAGLVPFGLDDSNKLASSFAAPVKVNIMTSSYYGSTNQIHVTFLDKFGKVVHEYETQFEEPVSSSPRVATEPILRPVEKLVVHAPLVRELSSVFEEWMLDEREANRIEMSKELLHAILNPEITDPLAITAGPTLIEYAEVKKEQLVAVLNDNLAYQVRCNADNEVDQGRYLRPFRTGRSQHRVEASNGWITIGINPQLEAQGSRPTNRLSRKHIGELLRQTVKDGFVSIESAASFVSSAGSDSNLISYNLATLPLEILDYTTAVFSGSNAQRTLKFYSSLSGMQRNSIKNGESLIFGTLTEPQKRFFRYELYTTTSPSLHVESAGRSASESEVETNFDSDIEPTEKYLPDISPSARLSVTIQSDILIEGTGPDAEGGNSYNNWKLSESGEYLAGATQKGEDYNRFRVISQRTLAIRLALDKSSALQFEVSEYQHKTPVVDSIDKLPPEIAQQIRKDMAKFKPPLFRKLAS